MWKLKPPHITGYNYMNVSNIRPLIRHLNKLGLFRSFSKRIEEIQLVDYIELSVRGGKGGNGCTAKKCRNRVKQYMPDGGNGGHGGDVTVSACASYKDLSHLVNKTVVKGGSGSHGTSKITNGEMGRTKTIYVPVGTIIGNKKDRKMIAELVKDKDEYCVAVGGKGGLGNYYTGISVELNSNTGFKYDLQAFSAGKDGTEQDIYIELKTIADVGLVGFPNSGKSSLLRAISKAKPKVASYPFTTLRPHVGTIHFSNLRKLVMADIPGIIKGASQGKGLGHSFLKHIERCHSLLIVIDIDSENPIEDIITLLTELELYKLEITNNIIAVVINKVDLVNDIAKIQLIANRFPLYKILPISALYHKNINLIRDILESYSYTTLHD